MQQAVNALMPKSSGTKNHLLFIDSVRALAAVYVVLNHAVVQYYDSSVNSLLTGPGNHLSGIKKISIVMLSQAHYAVDIFIVLSGFSLMLTVIKNDHFLKGGTWVFFKRRVIRIIPPYYCAMLLSLILIWFFIGHKTGTHWDVALPVTKADIITHLLLIQDFFLSSASRINHVFWSIAVEFRICLFFPLLVFLWRRKGAATTLIIVALISVVCSFILLIIHRYSAEINLSMAGVSPYIILFALGMLGADMSFSHNKTPIAARNFYAAISPKKAAIAVIFYLLLIAIVKYVFKTNDPDANVILVKDEIIDVLIGILGAFLLFACSVHNEENTRPLLFRILYTRPLVFIGSFSYSLYLIHAPLVQLITQYILAPLQIDNHTKCVLLIVGGIPPIIGVSYLFFWLFERPFLRLGKKVSIKKVEQMAITNPAP